MDPFITISMNRSKDIKEPNAVKWWIITILVCLLICVSGFLLTEYLSRQSRIFPIEDGYCAPALFGDSFGAVNALISAFAFAGMIVTFVLQRYELSMQRKELEAQRMEFSSQNETLRLQRFEHTFFNMMELQQSIVNDLYVADSYKDNVTEDNPNNYGRISKEIMVRNEYKGRNIFYYVFNVCKHQLNGDYVNGLRGVLQCSGLKEFDRYFTTTVFDHYFRHLYTILKFIGKNDWLGDEKQYEYATFVRATLSRYELVMLYYNGFFHPKMKKLIERYSMLNNLRHELLPVSLENLSYLRGLNLNVSDLTKNSFSGSDFEFFLTDRHDEDKKYYLGAFYAKQEHDKGKDVLRRWNTFIDNRIVVKEK